MKGIYKIWRKLSLMSKNSIFLGCEIYNNVKIKGFYLARILRHIVEAT